MNGQDAADWADDVAAAVAKPATVAAMLSPEVEALLAEAADGETVYRERQPLRGRNCRSGCKTRDHATWAECARAGRIGVAAGETTKGVYR